MIVIGLISGTSADSIDAAVADVRLDDGVLRLEPLGHRGVGYPSSLREALWSALPPTDAGPADLCRLDAELGQAFGQAAAVVNEEVASGRAELVVSHGQTIHHWVDETSGRARGTLQLGQPAWIAEATGLPVVADLRNRDIAAGGHGAPLAAYPDVLLLAGRERAAANGDRGVGSVEGPRDAGAGTIRGLLNIGGIANVTLRRPDGSSLAFDTGPGNALIDAAVADRTHGTERFDRDGVRARRGRVDEGLLEALLADPYYARPAPKSTGKEHFHVDYLTDHLARVGEVATDDVVATLTALTAETIARAAAEHRIAELVASGGGTANPAVMAELRARADGVEVRTIDELGVPSDAKEAYWFAVLGFCTVHGVPGVLPSCTGAPRASVLGHLTPGRDGFPPLQRVDPPVAMQIVR